MPPSYITESTEQNTHVYFVSVFKVHDVNLIRMQVNHLACLTINTYYWHQVYLFTCDNFHEA
jgi:hypothetical protein